LIDIVENNLHESYEKAILDHLAQCPQCNRLVRSFAHAWKELSSREKYKPSERFWPELLTKVEDSEKPRPLREKIITGLRNSLRPATVSLILFVGVFVGYQLGNRPSMDATLLELSHIELFVQDFQDFPEGSVGDFMMTYEIPLEEEKP
jgi:hypothetical protein